MTVKDLERLYEYNYWANKRLFQVLSQLTPEQFTQDVAGSYGSIRNTLVHIMSAEWGWLDRCGGQPRGEKLNPADYPTLEVVVATWNNVERYMREFLATLTDEDLARNIEFKLGQAEPQSRSLSELLEHGAILGVHHRGQVALLLRMLGYTPGNFDHLYHSGEKQTVQPA